MSALDGFYATWNKARRTFGEGTPPGGTGFDASAILGQLGEDVAAAAPGDGWTGTASEAYGAANTKHGANLTTLTGLDRRLGAQLDQAADVVTTGRSNLDDVRQRVTDAAGSVPPGALRDTLLMRIASTGLGQVSDIVQTSNDANNIISDNINNLTPEYEAINYGGEFKEQTDGGEGEPQEQPDEESDESKAARWYTDWAMLEREIAAHNAEVAVVAARRPPLGSNPAVVSAYNVEVSKLSYRADTIYIKQLKLRSEGLLLNIPVETPQEPIIVDAPFQIPGTGHQPSPALGAGMPSPTYPLSLAPVDEHPSGPPFPDRPDGIPPGSGQPLGAPR